MEAEIEAIETSKKGRNNNNDQIEELNKLLEKLRDHVQKLETLLLMLNSDAVEIHQIKDIKDDLEYYIENCRDPDFMENDMLYEDIDGLEEMLLDEGNDSDFDYLFKIISFSIFKDKVAALRKKMAEKKMKLKIMEDKSPADIYNEDLDEFLAKLESEPSDTVPFYVHDDDSDDDDDSGSGSDFRKLPEECLHIYCFWQLPVKKWYILN